MELVIIMLLMMFVVTVFSVLSFIFRKPGPKGECGKNATPEEILDFLSSLKELDLSDTIIKVKDVKKKK